MADPMMPPNGAPPAGAPDDAAIAAGKAVCDAYRKAIDVIEGDPELCAACANSPSLELTSNEDGSIDVEMEAASTTILASELQPSDAAKPAPGAPPPFPPAA